MQTRTNKQRFVTLALWAAALGGLIFLAVEQGRIGWDLEVYRAAMVAVGNGQDPYLSSVAERARFFSQHATTEVPPYGYVYPPVTIFILSLFSKVPWHLFAAIYWGIYCVMALLPHITVARGLKAHGLRLAKFLLPLTLFFPGMVFNSWTIFSGNVSYIVYGVVAIVFVYCWKRDSWYCFYLSVLLAMLIKPTFCTLLLIPILVVSSKQYWYAIITGCLGFSGFLFQKILWPSEFSRYELALQSQMFTYTHDFGVHPAGLFADAMFEVFPQRTFYAVLYVACALLFGYILVVLRRKYISGEISFVYWLPMALMGMTLMNPRIMEYDMAAITLAVSVMYWRMIDSAVQKKRWKRPISLVGFVLISIAGFLKWHETACLTLVVLYLINAYGLYYEKASLTMQSNMLHPIGEQE